MSGYVKEEKQKNVKSYHVPGFVITWTLKHGGLWLFMTSYSPACPQYRSLSCLFCGRCCSFLFHLKLSAERPSHQFVGVMKDKKNRPSASFPTTVFTVNDHFKLYTFLSGLVPWVSTLNSSSHSTPTPVRIKITNTFLRGQRGLIAVVNSEQFSY